MFDLGYQELEMWELREWLQENTCSIISRYNQFGRTMEYLLRGSDYRTIRRRAFLHDHRRRQRNLDREHCQNLLQTNEHPPSFVCFLSPMKGLDEMKDDSWNGGSESMTNDK